MLAFRGYRPRVLFDFNNGFRDFNDAYGPDDTRVKPVRMKINKEPDSGVFAATITYDVPLIKEFWRREKGASHDQADQMLRNYFNEVRGALVKAGFECAYFDVPLMDGEQIDLM